MIIFTESKSFILSKLDGIRLTKLYYSIGEVASLFDVNASLIRHWEKEIALIQPKKNKKGDRLFTVKDIELFNKIYQLVKEDGYTLEGANKVLNSRSISSKSKKSIPSNDQIISRLEKIKAQLIVLKNRSLD
jgi:DNA-binding transcriptional MerR regulator